MGLYDDDKELSDGDLSGNQHFSMVKAALDALAAADNATLAKDAARLRDVYDSLAKLVAQFPKHDDVAALAKRGAELIKEPKAVFKELADVDAHVARLKGFARDVPKPTSTEVVDAVRIAAEARRILGRVAHLPGARELMALVDSTLREVHEKAGVLGAPGEATKRGLGRKVALEIVLDKCTSMEIAPMGVCLGCDLRLSRQDARFGNMEIVVGCELKQRLTPPLRVAFSKRRGPGLLGMMTLAEHHHYFVEMYEELTADERAKIDPLIDRLYERYVERS